MPILIPRLLETGIDYTIKKNGSYACITTPNFKFLDIINYLAAGVSYASFLKSQNVALHKTYFPYEWFSSLEKLEQTTFPAYDSFYSSLKNRNTLEPESLDDVTDHELWDIGRNRHDHPITPIEKCQIGVLRYQELARMFHENYWTFRDFLVFYNNR